MPPSYPQNIILEYWENAPKRESQALGLMSQLDQELLTSSEFFYKLQKQLIYHPTKNYVESILSFLIFESSDLSNLAMQTVLRLLKIEDGLNVKAPMRAAMIIFSGECNSYHYITLHYICLLYTSDAADE